MFWRMLKKDLKRKKTMNLILFTFIILCSLFLSSSMANIMVTNNATNYFIDLSNVADQSYFSSHHFDEEMEKWLQSCSYVEDYEKSVLIQPSKEDVTLRGEELKLDTTMLHFTTADSSYSLMFDENDQVVTHVAIGEMAISAEKAKLLHIEKGDILNVKMGDETRSLKLTTLTKDAVYGKAGMSVARIFMSDTDYADLSKHNQNKISVWSIKASDLEKLRMDFNKSNIPSAFEQTRNTVFMLFYMEKISSVVFMIVAVGMILIALVLLQFTIRFTMEEDFREIGVMKAIGIKNFSIRGMYIVKYLVTALIGALIGFMLSFPFCELLIEPLEQNIIMLEVKSEIGIRIFCSLSVILLTLFFCWRATKQVTKMSAIQAIREGSSGERFKHKGILKLHGSSTKVAFFMASNDILSGLRSYLSIFLALVFGMLTIILPANAASTLSSGKSIVFFGLSKADAYADTVTGFTGIQNKTYSELKATLLEMEDEFANRGILIKADAYIQINPKIYKDDKLKSINVAGFKRITEKPTDVYYFAGTAPKLSNEIGISDVVMRKLDIELGDTVTLQFGEEEEDYIVTGQVQSMSNGGDSIVFSSIHEPSLMYSAGAFGMLIDFIDRNDITGQIEKAKEVFPQYNIVTSEGKLRGVLGDAIDTMNSLVAFLFLISLMIICLVVYLISHTLLVKDQPIIAFLKSIGFANGTIRLWQMLRMLIVSIAAVLFGIGLSFIFNPLSTKLTFGMMGADKVPPQYNVLWTFILYPCFILMGVILIFIFASFGIGRISMRTVGNLE